MVLKAAASVGTQRRGARISLQIRTPPAALAELDVVHVRGSGSTLIAAEKTRRVCRGIELDPLYIDVIVRRYEATTGKPAILANTGEKFDEVAARRAQNS